MSDTKHVVVTREGLQRMKEELEYKETTEKMKVAEQLKVAISYGDLSENAEYDAAKNDQAVLEQRITELKAQLPPGACKTAPCRTPAAESRPSRRWPSRPPRASAG